MVKASATTTGGQLKSDTNLIKIQYGSAPATTAGVAITGFTPDTNLSATDDDSVTISGTTANVVNGTLVTVFVGGGGAVGTASVNNGTWSLSGVNLSAKAEGNLSVQATVSAVTDTVTVFHDTIAPVIGFSSGPNDSSSTPTITGTSDLVQGATLTVKIDTDGNGTNDVTYGVTVGSGGTWSLNTASAIPTSGTFPAAGLTGDSIVTATGTDGAGNTGSGKSASITSITTDPGQSAIDYITSDSTLTISGLAAPGATVQVYINNVAVGLPVTAGGTGVWSYVHAATLADGTYTVKAVATSGTSVSTSANQTVVVDTTAPAVAISSITTDSGASGTDYITNDNTLVFAGTASANTSVLLTLTNSSGTVFTTTVSSDGSGNWSLDRTGNALADGSYTLTAQVADVAGNTATPRIRWWSTPPPPSRSRPTRRPATPTPVVTGTSDFEAGRTVTVTISGATYHVTTDASGNWSVDTGSATPFSGTFTTLTDGSSYTITASGSDTAGNSANASKSLTVDLAAPVINVTEPIGDGDLNATEDNSVVISGTSTNIPVGSTITVTISDGTITIQDTTTVGAGGSWSLAALNLSAMANGVINVSASYTDDLGNTFSDPATVLHNKAGAVSIDSITDRLGHAGRLHHQRRHAVLQRHRDRQRDGHADVERGGDRHRDRQRERRLDRRLHGHVARRRHRTRWSRTTAAIPQRNPSWWTAPSRPARSRSTRSPRPTRRRPSRARPRSVPAKRCASRSTASPTPKATGTCRDRAATGR